MQTILGSGGAIGIELAKALKEFTSEIKLVSRNPKKINTTDELMSADLLNVADVRKAVHRFICSLCHSRFSLQCKSMEGKLAKTHTQCDQGL